MKKILGIIMILLGAFLTLSTISQAYVLLLSIRDPTQLNSAYTKDFLAGQILALTVFLIASFFLIRYGLKWLKVTKQPTQKEV